MPPKAKKGKSSAKKSRAGTAVTNTNWETGLTKTQFEEESWRACVSFVVGKSPEEDDLIQALAAAVQKPLRKLFSLLTWDSTVALIQELGNPKAKKTDDVPMFYEVTEPAKLLLDAGEEIPCELMAKILKFQLLQIKALDLKRRESEKAEEETLKAKPPSAKDKGEAKAPDKKGKNAPSRAGSSKDKKTKLKRRDDVEPPTFIDDEPEDGPHHYILVLGFYQPQLIKALDAIDIHVANVVKLCQEHTQTSKELQEQPTRDEKEQTMISSTSLDTGDVYVGGELDAQTRKMDGFWSSLGAVLDSGPPESKLYDVVQLSYTVPDLMPPSDKQESEAEPEIGSHVFEGVANLIYDCLDWRRQHQRYLDNIKLISVAAVGLNPLAVETSAQEENFKVQVSRWTDKELPRLSTDVDLRYYKNLLDLVPPESCSVPLVLHCMLEQVVLSAEEATLTHVAEDPTPQSGSVSDHQQLSFMLASFLPLLHTREEKRKLLNSLLAQAQNEEDKKKLLEKFETEEPPNKTEHPLVIRHHDERALRFRDVNAVEGFDPAEVESSIMGLSLVSDLIHSVAQERNSNSCWMAVKQQLQHYCTDDVVSWLEVERLLHQSVFESMPLTKVDQSGVLLHAPGPLGAIEPAQQQAPVILPWDNPPSYAKQQLKKLLTKGPTFLTEHPADTENRGRVSQLDVSDIQNCRLRSLFDWHYSEHHNASVFAQVLQSASEEYRCLDTFRGSMNNILYIFCHNPMSPYRQCKESWDLTLHTDVKFRKYLEYVAETVSDWTKEEELKREEMLLRNQTPAESPKDEKIEVPAEVDEENTPEPVIRKDSLKAWKLEQERLKEEEMTKKSKKDGVQKFKQQKEEVKSADNKKSGKKSRAETANSTAKTPGGYLSTTVPPQEERKEQHPTEELFNGFIGYGMDGKLVHVSGHLQYLFPSDGGHVTVENIHFVEGSSLMKVTVKKDGHRFCTHINEVVDQARPISQPKDKESTVNDCKEPETMEKKRTKQGSLSAVLDNGINLSYSFYGPAGECRVRAVEAAGGPQETSTFLPNPPSSPSHEIKSEGQPTLASTPFNSLNLSVPNGLLLQFLREDVQGESSERMGILVKQGFPLHGSGPAGQLQDQSLSKEMSRLVTSQGAVIRYMRDGSTQVLFADGSVSNGQDSGPVWVPDSDLEDDSTSQGTKDEKKDECSEKENDSEKGCWLTTTPSGARIHTVGTTHKHIPTPPILVFKATDPITHEVMLSREDLVVSVTSPDGSQSVEHADGTRITSIYQDQQPNTSHLLLHTGKRSESVTLTSTSVCACGCIEHSRDDGEKRVYEEEESMLADENNKRSACDNDKRSLSTKERVVLVEKEGCATVLMYPERQIAHILLADGTVITGTNQGAYQVFPSSVGLLQIQSDGKCVYSSEPLVALSPNNHSATNQPGSYTMSHTDRVACDITDPDGNHFQVLEDGQLSVLNLSPAPSTLRHNEEEQEDEMVGIPLKHRQHCPRLFMVHEDGSGTELLRSQTVEKLLKKAYSDSTVALLKEPLPNTQEELGFTVLKPSQQNVWSQWLLGKQNPDITPPNLRNRTWHDFPRTEKRVPGPPFGTDLGQGLTLREGTAQHHPVRNCPETLEMREFHQHRPITSPHRNTIDTRLKEYIESLMVRYQGSEEMEIKEPRSEEESAKASELFKLVLSFAEDEDSAQIFDKRTSEDIANLYKQGVDVSEDTDTISSDSLTSGKESNWSVRLAQHRQELSEEQAYREALRKRSIVPFFHPDNYSLFQELLRPASALQRPDMRSLSMALPPMPRSDSAEADLKDVPHETTPRPLNPTPSKSASHNAGSSRMHQKRSPDPKPETTREITQRGSPGHSKSIQMDVTGTPRRTKVRLPASILGSKPCSTPNKQFLSVEEPVRRKCRTISMTDPDVIVRGFQLLPSSVNFGTLQRGDSATTTVVMKNVGVDTCRFHVKQPPPATGLRVLYNPGPVAAGLQVKLHVQLFAYAGEVEPKKYFTFDIVIHTETDILYLPVTATVLSERLFEIWLKEHGKKSSKVRQLTSSSLVGQGAKRPSHLLPRPPAKTGNS